MWLVLFSVIAGSAASGSLEQALASERDGDLVRASDSLERLVRDDPGWALARIEAGRLQLKLGRDFQRAEMHLDAARALAPENARVHYLWGLLMDERGRRQEAIRSFEIAVLYRPDYADARFRLAGHYFSEGDWAQAEVHYRALSRLGSEWSQARLQLAASLEREGKLAEAEDELARLVAEQPQSASFRRKLGEFYTRTQRPELAEKLLAEPKKKMRELNKSIR